MTENRVPFTLLDTWLRFHISDKSTYQQLRLPRYFMAMPLTISSLT